MTLPDLNTLALSEADDEMEDKGRLGVNGKRDLDGVGVVVGAIVAAASGSVVDFDQANLDT